MQFVGRYQNRQVFWLDYGAFPYRLPGKHWVCLAIANNNPDRTIFEAFTRSAIASDIAEFKGHGQFGELLHDCFDEIVVAMEVLENHPELDVMTTWHNDETLADAFWQCFGATCLPEDADLDNITVVVTDLDGVNRIEELKDYIRRFESGWLPD